MASIRWTANREVIERDSREKGQDYEPEGETMLKAAEALRRGADAARGRGRRKSRWYQRTGARN